MPDTKLSDLTAATSVDDADSMYVVQGGASKKASLAALRSLIPHTPTAVFGDGVAAASLVAGLTCFVRVPYGGTIVEWALVANDTCTCVVDVWKDTTLPTVADSITASAKPGLTAGTVASDSTLTGWATGISAGDILGFKLDSVSGAATQITLTLKVV